MDTSNASYRKGDRVRHPTQQSWGMGEVLEDSDAKSVRVFFEGAGEKTLQLAYVRLIKIAGADAESKLLDNLYICKHAGGIRFQSLSDSIQYFLAEFPGGFSGAKFLENERTYKEKAHRLAQQLLERGALLSLLDGGQHGEVCARALKVVNATNLIFPNEKMQIKDAIKPAMHAERFASAIVNLLYGPPPFQSRFERFATLLEEIGAAKWTVATYFPFFVFPSEHMFMKPMVTQHAAELCGFEIGYEAKVGWKTYDRLLAFSGWLCEELTKRQLKPRDMIDVQSFVWCIAPANYG